MRIAIALALLAACHGSIAVHPAQDSVEIPIITTPIPAQLHILADTVALALGRWVGVRTSASESTIRDALSHIAMPSSIRWQLLATH